MADKQTTKFDPANVKNLPRSPGVYLMKDADGEVIYVGKAINLRSRVRSYFSFTDTRFSVKYLVDRIHSIDTLVTESERQALVLESDLIKKYKPHYNIRLKDDKAYLMVRINTDADYPRLELVRRQEDDSAEYIGPFTFAHELRTLLEVIKRTIPLRTCTDRIMQNRIRPCLEYQIKRCSGPCCLNVRKPDYAEWLNQARDILQGNTARVIEILEVQMERASTELRFEDAAVLRDRLDVLKKITEERASIGFGHGSQDAWGIYREGQQLEISVLSVRNGRLFESRSFGFSDVSVFDDEILSSLLGQYYSGEVEVPEEILIGIRLEDAVAREEILSEKRGTKVSITQPQRGVKYRLQTLAERNARENFVSRFGGVLKSEGMLRALQTELGLDEMPRVVECIDVSHFQGGETVASVIVFKDGVPDKQRYRLFRLSQEGKPDDFASMKEVCLRHLSRAAEENTLPDLIVIDGGPAQLAKALEARRELSLRQIPMVGLAKRRVVGSRYRDRAGASEIHTKPERVFLEGRDDPIVMKATSPALHFLEQIRDEAHRFAITFHRKRRSKRMFQSELEKIPGIGAERRKKILRRVKSMKELKEIEPQELANRTQLPIALCERVVKLLKKSD